MVRSLLVILAIVAGIVLLVPRPTAVQRPAADPASVARQAQAGLGFAPAVPDGLPATWVARNARVRTSVADIPTWHVQYQTPAGYVSLEQATRSTSEWEDTLGAGGADQAPEEIEGRRWVRRLGADRDVTTLVFRREGRVTLVTSNQGGLADATTLVRGLDAADLCPTASDPCLGASDPGPS
jgi:hypothetical protein